MEEIEIVSNINDVFKSVFKRNDIVLTPQTTANDVKGWDSLTHVMILDGIEKKFGVKFKLNEIVRFNNVGDIVVCLKQKKSN
jgi:acyl carrier protein